MDNSKKVRYSPTSMVALTPKESSTLALIAQSSKLLQAHPAELKAMMDRLGDGDARQIAESILNPDREAPPRIKNVAVAFQRWHQTNLRIGEARRSRRVFVDRRAIRQGILDGTLA
jgi:hypothetical protein